MLHLIEGGKIGVIITKDLSGLGRNYIEVGSYTEIYFPKNNVRYITVNEFFALCSEHSKASFKSIYIRAAESLSNQADRLYNTGLFPLLCSEYSTDKDGAVTAFCHSPLFF